MHSSFYFLILLNLLSNAVKYAKSKIIIDVSLKGGNILISIKDDGIGIPKEHHRKIFGKFYQVQDTLLKTETSTGLGLTIVKEFVKLHRGKIQVISAENEGTEFILNFPQK